MSVRSWKPVSILEVELAELGDEGIYQVVQDG